MGEVERPQAARVRDRMKDSGTDPPVLARDRARALRAAQTEVERKLWQRLRNRQLKGVKFRRQHQIGNYIADFVSLDAQLVVELDGSQHGEQSGQLLDQRRTEYLERLGVIACLGSGTKMCSTILTS